MTIYPVAECFSSVQGEGNHVGTPAVFLRLAGCNLKCSFCDTDHLESVAYEPTGLVRLVSPLLKAGIGWVVVTGGEPTIRDLSQLSCVLRSLPVRLALETNGTRALDPAERFDWVTVSPKSPPGIDAVELILGSEIKVPVWSGVTDDEVAAMLGVGEYRHRFVQPVEAPGESWAENVQRSIEIAVRYGCNTRVSGQMHKRLKVR
jgi:7-carboxy-7-deazaguanine synthase